MLVLRCLEAFWNAERLKLLIARRHGFSGGVESSKPVKIMNDEKTESTKFYDTTARNLLLGERVEVAFGPELMG